MNTTTLDPDARRGQAGFTLVETLVAIVVLVFGLMAVTNLMLVAASSNTIANQSSAATASASQVMDVLRSTSWANLPPGGNLTADTTSPSPDCRTIQAPTLAQPFYNCDDILPGVGTIKTRWQITAGAGTVRLVQITVRSEGTGALAAARSRATFTTFRTCTQSAAGSCGLTPCCLTD
jgi:prepilin-type N-terminal cleavage/methylation domain-containing protein